MPRQIATAAKVDRDAMLEFVRPRHRATLVTYRSDGRLQVSPVTCGVGPAADLLISTYPTRAKAVNLRRRPDCSVMIQSDDWDGPYVQLNGTAQVIDVPDSVDGLVEYFRCIAGEHPDWAEYRQAMLDQGKSLIRISITDWGPVATGGFPPDLA